METLVLVIHLIIALALIGVVLDGVEAYRRWEFRTPLDPTQAQRAKPAATAAAAPADN